MHIFTITVNDISDIYICDNIVDSGSVIGNDQRWFMLKGSVQVNSGNPVDKEYTNPLWSIDGGDMSLVKSIKANVLANNDVDILID